MDKENHRYSLEFFCVYKLNIKQLSTITHERMRFSAREDPMTKVLKDENMRLMETVDTLHDQVEQQEHIAAMSRKLC